MRNRVALIIALVLISASLSPFLPDEAVADEPTAHAELIEELLKVSGMAEENGGVRLRLAVTQMFAGKGSRLNELASSRLANIAAIAAKYRVTEARVECHGGVTAARAQSVRRVLIENGMAPGVVKAVCPKSKTAAGPKANRRIELFIK